MKKLLTIPLFLPVFLFAQQKRGSFIKEHLYVKISPTLFAVAEETEHLRTERLAPAIFGVVGFKMRYAAVGFSSGYFKMKPSETLYALGAETINPLGVDLTITDFKQKVFPVLTAQWHRTPIKYSYQAGRYSTMSTEGKDLYSIGAGGAFRTLKTVTIMLTAGVSKLDYKSMYRSIAGGPTQPPSYYYFKDHSKMLFIAASLVW